MTYRTKTYVAAAWEEDQDAIEQLYKWNESDRFSLEFKNVHDFHQSKDGSLTCSIKENLSKRMDECKMFILIVGSKTNSVTRGACYNCENYKFSNYSGFSCSIHKSISNRSFIEFECEKAKIEYYNNNLKILVLYNSSYVDKNKCPEALRWIGVHSPMKSCYEWNYQIVKDAFDRAKYH